MPTWSILIATLTYRQELLLRLLGVLLPQAEKFPGQVEVVALRNRGALSIGEYRQLLLDGARGEYVSFVDDDDLVEADFVPVVLEAMKGKPDYVAFRNQVYWSGEPDPRPTITGLSYGGFYDTAEAYIRDVTHVNPARTELARQAGFGKEKSAEDFAYDNALRPLLKTEAVIDRVLYRYYVSQANSSTQVMGGPPRGLLARVVPIPQVRSPAFRWHEESVLR